VTGDVSMLPVVNDPGPPRVPVVGAERVGFSRLLLLRSLPTPEGVLAVPLVARAGDRVLFSLPLLMWMRAAGLDASEVSVHLGESITAGGRNIPIDEAGRLLLPPSRFGCAPEQNVLDLARGEEGGVSADGRLVLVGCDAQPSLVLPDGRTVSSASVLAGVVDALDREDYARPLHRLVAGSAGQAILGVLLLAVLAGLVMLLPRWARSVAGVLVLVAWFFAVRAQVAAGMFQPMFAPVLTWIVGFTASRLR